VCLDAKLKKKAQKRGGRGRRKKVLLEGSRKKKWWRGAARATGRMRGGKRQKKKGRRPRKKEQKRKNRATKKESRIKDIIEGTRGLAGEKKRVGDGLELHGGHFFIAPSHHCSGWGPSEVRTLNHPPEGAEND